MLICAVPKYKLGTIGFISLSICLMTQYSTLALYYRNYRKTLFFYNQGVDLLYYKVD